MRGARAAALVLGVLLAALVAAGCEPSARGQWFYGNVVAINLQRVQRVAEVRYQDAGAHWAVRPSDAGRELVAIQLDVRNTGATSVVFNINREALRLRDASRFEYAPVNPLEQREQAPEGSPEEGRHFPFLWGPVELPRQCPNPETGAMQDCRLLGWVVFEVPRGTALAQLVWETGDTVYITLDKQ